jgi:hypothetical protein
VILRNSAGRQKHSSVMGVSTSVIHQAEIEIKINLDFDFDNVCVLYVVCTITHLVIRLHGSRLQKVRRLK